MLLNNKYRCDHEVGSIKAGWRTCGKKAVMETLTLGLGITLHWCEAHKRLYMRDTLAKYPRQIVRSL